MFGDNILVTPKLNEPAIGQTTVDVVAILPDEANWFNYNTKLAASQSIMAMQYSDLEIGMWVKGGSILPILLHDNALSVLRAIDKPIKLEVFPNKDSLAIGYLVLDDGWSTKPNKSILNYLYQSDTL